MKTLFDRTTRDELIARIRNLDENSAAQWGTMNVYEMIQHCTTWDEGVLNDVKLKQALLGKIFGGFALKRVLKDDEPIRKNSPTSPRLRIKGTGDVEAAKATWIANLQRFENYRTPEYMHEFFGKMTREQVGQLGYKHMDHHLLQFGV
jgi:hypothetical protein